MYRAVGKRVLDTVVASVAIVLFGPILLLISLVIRLDDPGPALFRQKRVGRGGSEFIVWKFRSMPIDVPELESSAAQALPVTRVGRLLRRTSLDELPQLVNVLRGEMSLVGPRPPIPSQTELIALRRENGSLGLKPGMTGLAQIQGYDQMPNDVKARFDADYLRNVSLATDVGILIGTLKQLRKSRPTY